MKAVKAAFPDTEFVFLTSTDDGRNLFPGGSAKHKLMDAHIITIDRVRFLLFLPALMTTRRSH
jgi:hypothetical protein